MDLSVADRLVKDKAKLDLIRGIVALTPCTLHIVNVTEVWKYIHKLFEKNETDVSVIDKVSSEVFH